MSTAKLLAIESTPVSFDDAVLIADRCFPKQELGRRTIFLWREYNDLFFDGKLRVTPVLYVPTSPYGHWVGQHRAQQNIYLMFPGENRSWPVVRGVLLHEMIHQALSQRGQNPAHAGTLWCQEIMRISRQLGTEIWAGKYMVKKIDGKSTRVNEAPSESTGARILRQKEIAGWPQSIGLQPPEGTYSYK